MADPKKRLKTNVDGDFFVDSTCINCDTCRQLAPTVFSEAAGYSTVSKQPRGIDEERAATRALICCPTGSIGNSGKTNAKEVMKDFPLQIEDRVYYCGFNSPDSYGANSYFMVRADGNWMIDAPKFIPQIVEGIEKLGGLQCIFLTHRDDVADADRYAAHFGAKRIIHRDDISAQPEAEMLIDGDDEKKIVEGMVIIPTPGHTRGHCVLLADNKYLFTGDHLAWDRESKQLESWPDVCWYSWSEQKKSLERLRAYDFEWILPGHGQNVHLSADKMHAAINDLLKHLP